MIFTKELVKKTINSYVINICIKDITDEYNYFEMKTVVPEKYLILFEIVKNNSFIFLDSIFKKDDEFVNSFRYEYEYLKDYWFDNSKLYYADLFYYDEIGQKYAVKYELEAKEIEIYDKLVK